MDISDTLDIHNMIQEIKFLQNTVDYIVISMHCGQEYYTKPTSRQIRIAEELVEAGVDAIIGHGPHVAQSVEYIKGKPVYYSLGNFLFDQESDSLSNGLAAAIVFSKDGIVADSFSLQTANGVPKLISNN